MGVQVGEQKNTRECAADRVRVAEHAREELTPDEWEYEQRMRMRRRQRRKHRQMILRIKLAVVGIVMLCLVVFAVSAIIGAQKSRAEKNRLIAESESVVEAIAQASIAESEEELNEEWIANLPEIRAIYGINVYKKGWSSFFKDNSYCMAPTGNYVNAFRASLQGQTPDVSGTISYKVNLSGSGWLDWCEDTAEAGDSNSENALEAVCIRLTGQLADYYDVLYSVLQNGVWTDWFSNGEEAGTSGAGLRMDGIRISVVKKVKGQTSYAGNIDPNRPMVALTYDDGPSSSVTPLILATLRDNGGKATFFMVGKQAEKNLEIVKQMVAQGCEPGNHTYDHTLMTKTSADEYVAQLAKTNQVISGASGISPVLMRPCGGAKSDIGMACVGAVAMPAIMWSVDTLDWKTRDAQNTINTVLTTVQDGDIILMHDLYDATGLASQTIIPELVNRGFQLVTVSELASYRGGMIPGGTYSKFRPVNILVKETVAETTEAAVTVLDTED